MPYLSAQDYDISYFDAEKAIASGLTPKYPAYFKYQRSNGTDSFDMKVAYLEKWFGDLTGKKIIDVGCAKGFLVQELRIHGANAVGIDISEYAIGEAPDDVKEFVSIGDILDLSRFGNNEFDIAVVSRVYEMLDPAVIANAVKGVSRISKKSGSFIEIEDPTNLQFYNKLSRADWLKFPFDKGSVVTFIERLDDSTVI